jgi:hypothetical protein
MSFKALAWAVDQKTERAADKLVLLGLADRHNTEEHIARPSLAWLCDFSSLDRKTVIAALDRLESNNLITDSELRFGVTRQVKGYRLSVENSMGKTEPFQKRNRSENGGEEYRKRNPEPIRNRNITKESKNAREIPDDWKPTLGPDTETVQETSKWPERFYAQQLEAFVAHHQAKGTKSKNFNLQWKTWALGEFAKRALKGWTNDECSSDGQSRNAFAVAAASFAARNRAGARTG